MNRQDNLHNYRLSIMVAMQIKAQPYRCWRNAALAVLQLPELFEGGTYVEGWVVVPGKKIIQIVEHGWSVTRDRQIVDPSIVLLEEEGQAVDYFSGVVISRGQLRQIISETILPLVCSSCYGEDGMGHSGYKDACEHACLAAHLWAQKMHLSETAIEVYTKENKLGRTIIQSQW